MPSASQFAKSTAIALATALSAQAAAASALLQYSNVGVYNPTTYSFKA